MNFARGTGKSIEATRWYVLVMLLLASPGFGATVSIETIVRNGDAVPGRSIADPQIVFFGESGMRAPSINDSGYAVFKAKSAKSFNINTATADGIYVHRPGLGLDVLVDTTGAFEVDGKPAGAVINLIRHVPLLNNNGDVLFHGRYFDPDAGVSRFALLATTTAGDPIQVVVDTGMTEPASGTAFTGFTSGTTGVSDLTLAALNDNGSVVFYGIFNAGGNTGLFGTSMAGGTIVRLADDTNTVSPIDQLSAFRVVEPLAAISGTGDVTFRGRVGGTSCCGGVFTVPVAGGDITTVAFRGEAAPPSGAESFGDTFAGHDMNDVGQVLFQNRLDTTVLENGLYVDDVSGGSSSRVVDTLNASPMVVPGKPGAVFDNVFTSTMNAAGQTGFLARVAGTAISNDMGIYLGDGAGSPILEVASAGMVPPGQVAPAEFRRFDGSVALREGGSATINDDGNLALTATGVDSGGASLRGGYFYDNCAAELVRIADTATASLDLGETPLSALAIWQAGDSRSGSYRSLNNSNDVSFVASFDPSEFGMYIAHVNDVGGGPLTITCPSDAILVCGADTSPDVTGYAAAEGCGEVSVTFDDVVTPACGNTVSITRTWTATSGTNTQVCMQFIETKDVVAPTISSLTAAPLVVEIGQPVNLSTSFTDNCAGGLTVRWDFGDGTIVTTFQAASPSAVSHTYFVQNIYAVNVEVADACGNTATDQIVIVAFDPNDGFSTGGGNFVPNLGSFVDGAPITDPDAKAHFGFVVKYKKNSISPEGNLQFVYKAGDITLHDTSMEWLVISGSTVRFKGAGTNNGEGEFTFRVRAEENGEPGADDTFQVEIWDGLVDTENDPPTPLHRLAGTLSGGNIQVH